MTLCNHTRVEYRKCTWCNQITLKGSGRVTEYIALHYTGMQPECHCNFRLTMTVEVYDAIIFSYWHASVKWVLSFGKEP